MDANEIAFELLNLREKLDALEFSDETNIAKIKHVRAHLTLSVDILHSLKEE